MPASYSVEGVDSTVSIRTRPESLVMRFRAKCSARKLF
jgi:hypothetical protein